MKNIYFIIALLTIGNCIEVKAGWYELLGFGRTPEKSVTEAQNSIAEAATETQDSAIVNANDTDKLAGDYLSLLKQAANSVDKNSEIVHTVKHAAKVAFVVYASQSGCANKAEKAHMLLNLQEEEMNDDARNAARELDSCLFKNKNAPRTEHGVPLPCLDEACKLALYASTKIVDEKIEKFNKYTPAPTQTVAEYEAKLNEETKEQPKSRGWFW